MKYQQALCIVAGLLPLIVVISLDVAVGEFVLFKNYISDLGVGTYASMFNASLAVTIKLTTEKLIYSACIL